ncbi:MAG: hypothetical protein EP319_11785 [Deltaproteobacteria bacterium]|nr:MAG: hypothetical protein EP319_11785 [Deltaproteobacteria bacterium]
MAKNTERRRKKDKLRAQKIQQKKIDGDSKENFTADEKKKGQFQIFLVVGIALAAAMIIVVSLNA